MDIKKGENISLFDKQPQPNLLIVEGCPDEIPINQDKMITENPVDIVTNVGEALVAKEVSPKKMINKFAPLVKEYWLFISVNDFLLIAHIAAFPTGQTID